MKDIISRLLVATVASCSCQTKTNDPKHHADTCLYRTLMDAIEVIEAGRNEKTIQE